MELYRYGSSAADNPSWMVPRRGNASAESCIRWVCSDWISHGLLLLEGHWWSDVVNALNSEATNCTIDYQLFLNISWNMRELSSWLFCRSTFYGRKDIIQFVYWSRTIVVIWYYWCTQFLYFKTIGKVSWAINFKFKPLVKIALLMVMLQHSVIIIYPCHCRRVYLKSKFDTCWWFIVHVTNMRYLKGKVHEEKICFDFLRTRQFWFLTYRKYFFGEKWAKKTWKLFRAFNG